MGTVLLAPLVREKHHENRPRGPHGPCGFLNIDIFTYKILQFWYKVSLLFF
jgi:hypothetical protein